MCSSGLGLMLSLMVEGHDSMQPVFKSLPFLFLSAYVKKTRFLDFKS